MLWIFGIDDEQLSLQQLNSIDCGLFLLHNAEIHGRGTKDPGESTKVPSEVMDGEKLRIKYLRMCIDANNRSRRDAVIEAAALGKPDSRKRKRRED